MTTECPRIPDRRAWLGGVGLALALIAVPAAAAVFTVNSTADAVDANPGDGVCETASGNGVCTLRAAIQEANATLNFPRVVAVPAGTYVLAIAGADEDDAATGDLDLNKRIVVDGRGVTPAIVDGGGLDRVFDLHAGAEQSEITDLEIRNGNAGASYGGGVRASSQVTIGRCTVAQNQADRGGGLAAVDPPGTGPSGRIDLTDSMVESNQASLGGGVYVEAPGTPAVPNLFAVGSALTDNTATARGGGVFVQFGSVRLEQSALADNTAFLRGGGAAIGEVAGTPSYLTLQGSDVLDNVASFFAGGGLWIGADGTLASTGSTLAGNSASNRNGGGAYLAGGTVALTDTEVSTTAAVEGGGIYVEAGDLTMTGGALRANAVTFVVQNPDDPMHGGGGLLLAGGTASLGGSVVEDNEAPSGCGGGFLVKDGALTVSDSEIRGNLASNVGGLGQGGGLAVDGGSALVERSTVTGNQAPYAGGAFIRRRVGSAGVLALANSTVTGNVGGGIWAFDLTSGGQAVLLDLAYSTVVENDPMGIQVYETTCGPGCATLEGTILANNVVVDCYSPGPFSIASEGYNLSSDDTCNLDVGLGDLENTDPLLGPLQDNGGSTRTHDLMPGSPAIDAGPSTCAPIWIDQRGRSRPEDGDLSGTAECDIGSVEFGADDPTLFADGFESGDTSAWSATVP